jgi:hypothetical protein
MRNCSLAPDTLPDSPRHLEGYATTPTPLSSMKIASPFLPAVEEHRLHTDRGKRAALGSHDLDVHREEARSLQTLWFLVRCSCGGAWRRTGLRPWRGLRGNLTRGREARMMALARVGSTCHRMGKKHELCSFLESYFEIEIAI